eukprot:2869830-Pyramimonas_sp.AAC.1
MPLSSHECRGRFMTCTYVDVHTPEQSRQVARCLQRAAARDVKRMYAWKVCAVGPVFASPCSFEGLTPDARDHPRPAADEHLERRRRQ